MHFKNHKLDGWPFKKARWTGGVITPEIVVLHDTASRLDEGNAARYLRDNDAKVSVHFVVERDGMIEQQVPINRRANHAGRSHYHGRSGCNGFSIGIEIVNSGRMTRVSNTRAMTWFGKKFDIEEYGIQEVTTPEHGHGLWMPYTEEQMDSVVQLLEALFYREDHELTDIRTHWYVSPGRKVDTNPLFPLEHIRSRIFGREDPMEKLERGVSDLVVREEYVEIDAPSDTLNMRSWPSFNPNVIATIPHGAVVPLLKIGEFDGREWLKVLYGGQEGWIVGRYTAPIVYKNQES
ncbi:N-acetylmuramoyl-L-alanine amidase [Profundibacter sp.]